MIGTRRLWSIAQLALIFVAPGVISWCVFHAYRVFLAADWSIKLGPSAWDTYVFWLVFAVVIGSVQLLGFFLALRYVLKRVSTMGDCVTRAALLISGFFASTVIGALGWALHIRGILVRLFYNFGPLVLVIPVVLSAILVPSGFLLLKICGTSDRSKNPAMFE